MVHQWLHFWVKEDSSGFDATLQASVVYYCTGTVQSSVVHCTAVYSSEVYSSPLFCSEVHRSAVYCREWHNTSTVHSSAVHRSMVQNLGFGLGAGRCNYTALLHVR